MVRYIGYVIARRDCDDIDESYDWAIAIEVFLGHMFIRFCVMFGRAPRFSKNSRRG